MRQYAPHVIAWRLTATLLSQFKLNTILLESCKNPYTQPVKGNYNSKFFKSVSVSRIL